MDFQDAIELIRQSVPASQADVLVEHLLPSSRIVVHDDGDSGADSIGSHFGGVPSLPPGMAWPVWDKRDYLRAEIDRIEMQFRTNPRHTGPGLRSIAEQMQQELLKPPVPLLFLGQLSLGEIHATDPLPDWPAEGSLAALLRAFSVGIRSAFSWPLSSTLPLEQ